MSALGAKTGQIENGALVGRVQGGQGDMAAAECDPPHRQRFVNTQTSLPKLQISKETSRGGESLLVM